MAFQEALLPFLLLWSTPGSANSAHSNQLCLMMQLSVQLTQKSDSLGTTFGIGAAAGGGVDYHIQDCTWLFITICIHDQKDQKRRFVHEQYSKLDMSENEAAGCQLIDAHHSCAA